MDIESELIYEAYLLNEMPYRIKGNITDKTIDNDTKNREEANRIVHDENYEHIGDFGGHDVYELDIGFGSYYLDLIKDGKIRLHYYFKDYNDDFIQTKGVYQIREDRGLMQEFFINFILKEYKNVVSDDSLTDLAMGFWIKIITKLQNQAEFGVVDPDGEFFELGDIESLREFHDSTENMRKYNFYIKYFG